MGKGKENAVAKDIFNYLTNQNRPYSATDIFNGFHKEHGKTAVVKALEQLAEVGKIKEKTYGKQKVYFADQDSFPEAKDEDLRQMDAEIINITDALSQVQKEVKEKEELLTKFNKSLTTDAAEGELTSVTKEIVFLENKLLNLKSDADHVSPEEKDGIYRENEKYVGEWRNRKRMALDMLDPILEGYPKDKKALFEELGIETDENVKVSLPPK